MNIIADFLDNGEGTQAERGCRLVIVGYRIEGFGTIVR